MHFISPSFLIVLFILFVHTYLSFVVIFICSPVGYIFLFLNRGLVLWKIFAMQKADMFLCLLFVDCIGFVGRIKLLFSA